MCAEVPDRNLFLVLKNRKKSWGRHRLLRVFFVRTIYTLHLGAHLLQEQLYRDLGEIGGIVMIYRL